MKGTVIKSFRGLANTAPLERLGLAALTRATNVAVSADGALTNRPGSKRARAGALRWPYALSDQSAAFADADGVICKVSGDATLPVFARTASAPLSWTEVNGEAVFIGGADAAILKRSGEVLSLRWAVPPEPSLSRGDGPLAAGLYRAAVTFVLADGRETGSGPVAQITLPANSSLRIDPGAVPAGVRAWLYIAPADSTELQLFGEVTGPVVWSGSANALGVDCTTALLSPLPMGVEVIEFWRGRLYAAQPLPNGNTVVWISKPLAPHLFDVQADFFMVPGAVRMLAGHANGLVVGTDAALWAYSDDDGGSLTNLAPYGVPTGRQWDREPGGRIFIWTNRGVCAALPFAELTNHVSVPPGRDVHAAFIHHAGQRHFVVSVEPHGEAFNPHFPLT